MAKIDLKKLEKGDFFSLFGLFFLGLVFLSIFLAVFGIFYRSALIIYSIIGLAELGYIYLKNRRTIRIDRGLKFVLIFSLALVIILAYFTVPTVFSGRDQGSMSAAAANLAQNHKLQFSFPASEEFFKVYGPGRALNFPGFDYTKDGQLVTQFPLGYIGWLASFYSVFGLAGFAIANGAAFFIFLVSFYLLSRKFFKIQASILSFLLVATCFVFSWFFKFTLSENLALPLIWFGMLEFCDLLESKRPLPALAAVASFFLLLFVRIEAAAFLFMIVLVLFFTFRSPKKVAKVLSRAGLMSAGIILLLLIASIKTDLGFYKSVAKGFLGSFSHTDIAGENQNMFSSFFYVARIFWTYAIFNFLLFGSIGIVTLLKRKNYRQLVPFFILWPSFFYLVHPGISADHPWMLRRFAFAVIPVCIFYSIFFLEGFFRKKIYFYPIAFILIASNILVSFPYFTFSENRGLLKETKNISDNFTPADLVLFDREAAGDGWSMMSGPAQFLFGKQAVYFFNPEDLKKIDQSRFENIYLVIPDNNLKMYTGAGYSPNLITVKDYEIRTPRLMTNPSKFAIMLPGVQENVVFGKIYLLKKQEQE